MDKIDDIIGKKIYRVRILFDTFTLHVGSWTIPILMSDGWAIRYIDNSFLFDAIGYIDWSKVIAVAWRTDSLEKYIDTKGESGIRWALKPK